LTQRQHRRDSYLGLFSFLSVVSCCVGGMKELTLGP
jgi:hypothetical protein